jgi:hypothetical protein
MFRRGAVVAIGLVVFLLLAAGGCAPSNNGEVPVIPEPGLPIDIISEGGILTYQINGMQITPVDSANLDARFAHKLNFLTVIKTSDNDHIIKFPRASDVLKVEDENGTGYEISRQGNSLEWKCIGAANPISATGGDYEMPSCMKDLGQGVTITMGAFNGDWIHVDVED